MRRTLVLGAVLALAPATGWAHSKGMATPQPGAGKTNAQLGPVDRRFLDTATTANLAQIAAGRLALARASSTQVKSYARKMVDEHSKASDELRSLADQHGFILPAEPTVQQKGAVDHLSQLHGTTFDRVYMEQMMKDHRAALDAFRTEAREGQNADLKRFANQMLPTLTAHHDLAMRDLKSL